MSLTSELYELIIKIVDERVKEIKVTREEFDKISKAVSDLAINIKELSQRINEVVELQKKHEHRISKLEEIVSHLNLSQSPMIVPASLMRFIHLEVRNPNYGDFILVIWFTRCISGCMHWL
jgi:hypothetical protein